MKKTLTTLFVVFATSATLVSAQETKIVSGKIQTSGNSELTLPNGVQFSMIDYDTKKSLLPIRSQKNVADEEMVTLSIKAADSSKPKYAMIFNENFSEQISYNATVASARVPKGTYDLYTEFSGKFTSYVFKENVQVEEDMELVFDPSEATIPVEFHYFDENNKELHLDIRDGGEVVTKATADDMQKFYSIIHKDYGYITFTIDFGSRTIDRPMNFCVNKLSDKYYIGESTTIVVGSHYYSYKAIINDLDKNVYNSNPENLKLLSTEFTTSPAMKNHEYVKLPGIETAFICNGYALANTRFWGLSNPEDKGKVITYIDCPEAAEADEYKLNVATRPIITDGVEIIYDNEKEFSFIVAPLAVGNAKQDVKYLVAGSDFQSLFNIPEEGDLGYIFYPGHPEFSFAAPDGIAHFGNSVPVMSYRSVKMTYESQVFNIDTFHYLGRYGEIRETDKKLAESVEKETSNGTEVTITNNNIEIDGMPGKNITEILFDLNKKDNTAPTLQMLSFRDAEGNICDRFNSTQGAKMIAAGGDFTYIESPDPTILGRFTCNAPSSVKAFYALHGTENWAELSLVEIPEKFFMPAFGHFYEADLSNIVVEAADTWFDVRLEMTDAAGNYQKQTISPAFKVATSSSISQVKRTANNSFVVLGKKVRLTDNAKAEFTVRSIDGRTMQNEYADSIELNDMSSGIYVVTAVLTDGNVISTKIVL